MRWQSVLRALIAVAGAGVAVLVYVQFERRPAAPVDTTAPLADPAAISESEAGIFELQGADGAPTLSLRFARRREYADDRREFDDVTAVFMRAGVRHTMSAVRAVATGRAGPSGLQPEQIVFKGQVRLAAEGGVNVEVEDEATFYNLEDKTVIPGAMRFTRGRLSGSGVGADLYMDRSVLWINSEARLTVAPDAPGGAPIDAQAARIGLADADHFMVLEGDAVMTHQAKRLSADHARVSFAAEDDIVQYIELRGRSAVRATGTATTRRNLAADDINLAFAPGTGLLTSATLAHSAVLDLRDAERTTQVKGSQIDLLVGPDGETLTKLQATEPVEVSLPRQGDQPAALICARSLLAEGEDTRGLTRAVFSGAVDYRETRPGGRALGGNARAATTACGRAAATRVASAETLVLGLKGDLGQVETARFRQDFRVHDGDMIGTAAEGLYDSAAETLELRSPTGGARPKVESPELNVIGNEIDVNLGTDAFDARGTGDGRVESTLTPSTAARPGTSAGLFDPGKAITGQSGRLAYRRDIGTIEYEGSVFLFQGDSRLAADRVRLDDARGDLAATGSVRSTMVLTQTGEPAAGAKPTRVAAKDLVYTDSTRTAVYTGGAVLDTSSGERIAGERIVLALSSEERTLRSAEATAAPGGEVRVTLLEGRQAAGQKVVYDAATDKYRVHGTLAVLVVPAPERGPGECSVASGTLLEFARLQGASQMSNEGGALGTMRPVKCAEVIK